MSNYHMAELVYAGPKEQLEKLLTVALSALNQLDDRTEFEEEVLRLAIKLELALGKS